MVSSLLAPATDGDKALVTQAAPSVTATASAASPLPPHPRTRMSGCHARVGTGQPLLALLLCAPYQNGTLLEMFSGYVIWGR